MKGIEWQKLIFALALPQAAGAIGGLVSSANVPTWYPTIAKPAFTPPGWVFGPVWGALYLMMGVAFFLVLSADHKKDRIPFAAWFFAAHLVVNTLWSFLFFGLHSPFLAFIDIIVLWAMITLLLRLFGEISRPAGLLLVPYWLWVSFAALLNGVIWKMN